MKKNICGIVLLFMFFTGCAGGAKPSTNSPGIDLDAAIREAAAQMEAKIPEKKIRKIIDGKP